MKALILYHLACVTVRMDDQFDTDPVASVDFIRISHSRTHLRGPNASRASVKAKLFYRGFASMRYGMASVVKYRGSPLSTVSISMILGLVRFKNRAFVGKIILSWLSFNAPWHEFGCVVQGVPA
jgi:hypothetical protein